MEKNIFLIRIIKILILIININKHFSSYLPSALNQLNHFIYLDRMKTYINQNNFHGCSMHTGPNCYYTENKKLEMDKSEDDLINHYNIQNTILNYKKQWKTIYEQSKKTSYVESFNEINTYIEDYKKYIFSKNDSKQIPPSINLRLRLTFQSYDDITINGDIYAYPSKPIKFNTEYIYIEFFGKLRLHYGEDLKLKNQMIYPCKTFGIIESNNLSIRLGKKLFVCEYFYLRKGIEKISKIIIEGYKDEKKIFTINKNINHFNEKSWTKLILPNQKIDKLLIPGGIEVDNFSFVIETMKQYNIEVQFHANYKKRVKELVEDNDIY